MEKTPKEMLKAYVDSQKFNRTTEIMDAMKEMFRDVPQQVMVSELDTALGYERSQRVSDSGVENKPRNYRNGYSKKTVKTQLGKGAKAGTIDGYRNFLFLNRTVGRKRVRTVPIYSRTCKEVQ
ncbi:MAG: hypothetical protein HFF18_13275 [Oscillospiraceae bacterium]|nr:hypothetical protein [Oscillospiraceae bacterium]